MNTKEFLNHISQTYATGLTIIQKKNQDYANSTNPFKNFESALVVGIQPDRAILLRVMDKIARVSNLLDKEPVVKDESFEDTLVDCINYLAILKAYRERHYKSTSTIQGLGGVNQDADTQTICECRQTTAVGAEQSGTEPASNKYKKQSKSTIY